MILRDLKLDIIMGNQNPIIDKFNEITRDIKVINENVYYTNNQEFIFYNENNKWIFYQDVKNDNFWCNYNLYWSIFESEFNLEYVEIQDITKYLVEETLKLKVDTPCYLNGYRENKVEETLKVKVGTPYHVEEISLPLVEESLKLKVVTPPEPRIRALFKVEETLKTKL